MALKYERQYGSTDPIPLVVYAQDGIALEADAVVAGDVQISKDGGAFVQTANPPTVIGTDAFLWWTPTAAELTAKVIVVRVQDVGAAFAPEIVVIETYGHASSQHPDGTVDSNVTQVTGSATPATALAANIANLDATVSSRATDAGAADKLLGRNLAGGSDGGRTVTSALRKMRNKVTVSGGTMTVYAENDTTVDHTEAVTTAAGNPITEVDPV